MNETEIQRIAHAGNALRPDWPVASLRTWLTLHHAGRSFHDVARALAWVASDPDTRTPMRMNEAGPWWPAHAALKDQPNHPPRANERCRVHMGWASNCPGCRADAIARDDVTEESA